MFIMGVKKLWSLLQLSGKKAKGTQASEIENLTQDRTVGVDGSAVIHQAFQRLGEGVEEAAQAIHKSLDRHQTLSQTCLLLSIVYMTHLQS
jgi:hypothetical protein